MKKDIRNLPETKAGGKEKIQDNVTPLKKSSPGISGKVIAFFCVVVAALAIYLNWGTISPSSVMTALQNYFGSIGKNKYPVSYAQGDFKDAVAMGKNVGILTDSAFLIYSPTGSQLADRQHGLENPQITASGNNALIYDSDGTQLKVETLLSQTHSLTTQFPIITADINARGYYGFATTSHDYLSEMSVYDPGGNRIFKWSSSEGRIISLSLSPDGTRAAALSVTGDSGEIKSILYLYNLSKSSPITVINFPDTFLFSVRYKDDGSIMVVGNSEALLFSGSGKKISSYSYSDKTLKCYYNGPDNTVFTFSRYGVGKESTLVSLGSSGKLSGQLNISSDVKYLSAGPDYIATLAPGKLLYFPSTLSKSYETALNGDIVKLLCVKNQVYVFGPDAVYQYSLDKAGRK